jgi:hypothetical protein
VGRDGQAKKADRFKGGMENLGAGPMSSRKQSKEFDRIELAAKLFAPPPIKFKDLDASSPSTSFSAARSSRSMCAPTL